MSRTVIAAVDDMFFASKIRGTAEGLGVNVRFLRSTDAILKAALDSSPSLIIVDLHSERIEPIDLATRLRSMEQLHSIPLLGFFSHVQVELSRRAREAGFDQVVPRSAFTSQLPEILLGEHE
jgi:PleD family two-component response regulator